MSLNLDIALTVLVWVFIVFLAVLGVFLAKCLYELNKTLINITEITRICKEEAEPLLDELRKTLENVKDMTTSSTSKLTVIKNVLSSAVGAATLMLGNLKGKTGGFIDGLLSGFRLFKK